nr:MAG TPA: hypothetical protein [Caudoviricetes sp.]
MMARCSSSTPDFPMLFFWNELAEIDRLQAERLELFRRIGLLPRFSHRRIELQARLKIITDKQLLLQNTIKGAL